MAATQNLDSTLAPSSAETSTQVEAEGSSLKRTSLKRWGTLIQERFPLGTYLLLTAGFAVSGSFLSGWDKKIEGTLVAWVGLILFFFELRIMDELKDYRKDLTAHPERPLPRGLISVKEARYAVKLLFRAMLLYSFLCVLLCNLITGLFYLGVTLYLGLMYREFFVGRKLAEFPLVYAFTHQIVLIPLCMFAVAVHHPAMIFDEFGFYYSIAVFGAFFSYEICRKLDPSAHPVLKNYLAVYGALANCIVVWTLLTFAAYGALFLKAKFLWAIEASLALSLVVILFQPKRFKLVEAIAGLSLVLHIWAPTLQFVLKKFIR